ncbi:MAG TPA: hypothetical protein VG326_04850, partial [Tepidisphaeraceae bacterium]|nr:hypothetical protein [Tepidisphaeraceae bacterium]
PLEPEELLTAETDELTPLEPEELPTAETDELAPLELDELATGVPGEFSHEELNAAAQSGEVATAAAEEGPAETDEVSALAADELAPADEEESAVEDEQLTPLEAAERAAIEAGEMLPDDEEAPATAEEIASRPEVEATDLEELVAESQHSSQEPTETEVAAPEAESSAFSSFIDSLTEEDLQAHENVGRDSTPLPNAEVENVFDVNFGEGTIPSEYATDLVTADAFSPAEPAAEEDEIEGEFDSFAPLAEEEQTPESEAPAVLEPLDSTGDSLVDRLSGLEAEHLVDDPAHDRAALLHDEFDPERAVADDLGLEFEDEPPVGHVEHASADPHAAEVGVDEPMIEFENFLRELENPADPGRK